MSTRSENARAVAMLLRLVLSAVLYGAVWAAELESSPPESGRYERFILQYMQAWWGCQHVLTWLYDLNPQTPAGCLL